MSDFENEEYSSYKEFAEAEKLNHTRETENMISFLRMAKKCIREQNYIYLLDGNDRNTRRQKRISTHFIENLILDLHPNDYVNKTKIKAANSKNSDTFYVFAKKLMHSLWGGEEEVDFEVKIALLPVSDLDHEVACVSVSAFAKSDLGEWW